MRTRVWLWGIVLLIVLGGCDMPKSGTSGTSGSSPTSGGGTVPTKVPPTPAPINTLSLDLSAQPFSYRLVDGNKHVIVQEQGLHLTINGMRATVVSATNIQRAGTTIDADLQLSQSTTTVHAQFTMPLPNVVRLQLTPPNNAATQIGDGFVDQGDQYYGLFEYPFNNTLDNRGADRTLLGTNPAPNTINAANARAPFYLSSRGYGVYVESTAVGHFALGINSAASFEFNAAQLTYDIIGGPDYPAVLARYAALAGGAMMPPLWAFDSIWWKDDDHYDFHGSVQNAQDNVLDTANQLQRYQIPAGSEWIDRPFGTGNQGWGNFDFDSSFPNPSQMVKDLNGRGIKLMVWISNHAWNSAYNDASAKGYLFPGSASQGPAADLTVPGAVTWFQQKLNTFVTLGIRGYKIDRGDEGEMPDRAQNQNITLFAQLANQGLATQGTDGFVFARDAYDTGRKYTAIWNGDTYTTFTSLQASVISGIRSGLINFPMWGSDTGGYIGKPTKELFARWLEFSAYSPLMEVVVGNGRTPWYDYDQQLIQITRDQAALHHDLIPYTRSALYQAAQTGMPVMRALFLGYPADPQAAKQTDEYLYGADLLVAPIVTAGATSRQVYLPAGRWISYPDNALIALGGQSISAPAPLGSIPVFVREGAIIPRGDIVQSNNTWTPNWSPTLHIQMYPSASQSSDFAYYTGSGIAHFTLQPQANGTITLHVDDPGIAGTLEIAVAQVGNVTRNGKTLTAPTDYTFDTNLHVLRIPYSGATTVVLQGVTTLFG